MNGRGSFWRLNLAISWAPWQWIRKLQRRVSSVCNRNRVCAQHVADAVTYTFALRHRHALATEVWHASKVSLLCLEAVRDSSASSSQIVWIFVSRRVGYSSLLSARFPAQYCYLRWWHFGTSIVWAFAASSNFVFLPRRLFGTICCNQCVLLQSRCTNLSPGQSLRGLLISSRAEMILLFAHLSLCVLFVASKLFLESRCFICTQDRDAQAICSSFGPFACRSWGFAGGSVAFAGGSVGWMRSLQSNSLSRLFWAIIQSLRGQALRRAYVISEACIFPMSTCYHFCSIDCIGNCVPVRGANRNRSPWHRYIYVSVVGIDTRRRCGTMTSRSLHCSVPSYWRNASILILWATTSLMEAVFLPVVRFNGWEPQYFRYAPNLFKYGRSRKHSVLAEQQGSEVELEAI